MVHRAPDEWAGNVITDFLRANGVEAIFREPPVLKPLDFIEDLLWTGRFDGVYVFERDAGRARDLVREFLSAPVDDQYIEQAAAEHPAATKERIGELRAGLAEERRTFAFLGWLLFVLVVAAAIYWACLPDSVKDTPRRPIWQYRDRGFG